MPLTLAKVAKDRAALASDDFVSIMLFEACREVIPAAMSSVEGPLTPGSIVFDSTEGCRRFLTVDVFLEIEASYYVDRFENLNQRATDIRTAMEQLFPGLTFAVWPKLVIAGWSREQPDPEFDGDMSMSAALGRVRTTLDALWPTRGLYM